jgi:hypothetical protein
MYERNEEEIFMKEDKFMLKNLEMNKRTMLEWRDIE